MSRRLIARTSGLTGITAATALAAFGMLAEALSAPSALARGGPDQLVVSITDSGRPATNGTYTLRCHPTGGDHPAPEEACGALMRARADRGARDPFAAATAPERASCTRVYGDAAKARITGTWRGGAVDARLSRSSGCQAERWDRLVPALPSVP
ncbi:SSI family serine proteinase inhibitor [Streptomyces boncukensis]|uniref:Subtilisin inhibitor domain-containing protein n=1 Tax=Streptomyces boncukensis TaxID=2711219 RepID=A0A6G4WU58_9ACTN|nr:SSI family serine proteinase inhibitor [Streptomyces boncukensis]NGO68001.1 hypothetical protein [Streptomyces boncukensis]